MKKSVRRGPTANREYFKVRGVIDSVTRLDNRRGGAIQRWSFWLLDAPDETAATLSGLDPLKHRSLAKLLKGLGIDYTIPGFAFREEMVKGQICEIEIFVSNWGYVVVNSILRPLIVNAPSRQMEFNFDWSALTSRYQDTWCNELKEVAIETPKFGSWLDDEIT